jgi:hypothetical protein
MAATAPVPGRRSRAAWAALLVVAGAAYGCKDFLEVGAQGVLDGQSLANKAGVEGALIAAYRALDWNTGVDGSWGTAASNWVWGSVTSDDAYKGSEASDPNGIIDIELYYWASGAADGYLNDKWRGCYEGVVRSNATLRLLDTVVEVKPDELTQADQDGIRGEALFLRAFYHFEAWRMWGNIPYYREDDADFRETNVGVDAIGTILADLDEAIGLLPETPRHGAAGRATKWTAKAYKGRVQAYAGDYAGALTTLRDVQAGGPYALEQDFGRVWTGFEQYSNGPETIFAYQASANDGEPDGNNANYGERLNFPHSGSPFGCCGFHQPSQNLVNFFRVDMTGLPLAATDPDWNASDAELDAAASATLRVDPRLDWTVGRDGVPYKDWGLHEVSWIRAPAFGGPYSAKKTAYEDASGAVSNVGWVNTQLSSMNIHIYRYADMLLLLAEAEVEAGSPENARTIVNAIRTRAGAAVQGCGLPQDANRAAALLAMHPQCAADSRMAVPIDDPSVTWADYEIGLYPAAGWDQAFARQAVRFERRLELAMEGQRFFDLRRWGVAEQVLNAYLAVEATRRPYLSAADAFSVRHNLYPIPTIQIELSRVPGEERLRQNPGW